MGLFGKWQYYNIHINVCLNLINTENHTAVFRLDLFDDSGSYAGTREDTHIDSFIDGILAISKVYKCRDTITDHTSHEVSFPFALTVSSLHQPECRAIATQLLSEAFVKLKLSLT